MGNAIADLKRVWFGTPTGMLTESLPRMERMFWLQQLGLLESNPISLEDARQKAVALTVPGIGSLPGQYYQWLALQPGGNIPGSIRDREMAVFAGTPQNPPYSGKYLLMASNGVGNAFAYMQDGLPTLGGGVAITSLDVIVHARVPAAGTCHFWGLEEVSNSCIYFFRQGTNLILKWINNWAPYTQDNITVADPGITGWIWLRCVLAAGTMKIQSAPESATMPGSWTDLGSKAAVVVTRPSGSGGDGSPHYIGQQNAFQEAVDDTTNIHLRRMSWSYNGAAARDSSFETTATVVSNAVTDDQGHGYTKNGSMVMSIGQAP